MARSQNRPQTFQSNLKPEKNTVTVREQDIKKSPDHYIMFERGRGELMMNNLIGGVAWGVGATVGAALFISLIGFLIHQLGYIPFIGSSVTPLGNFFQSK